MNHYMCSTCLNEYESGTGYFEKIKKRQQINIITCRQLPNAEFYCCSCLQLAWPAAEYEITPEQYDCDCYSY